MFNTPILGPQRRHLLTVVLAAGALVWAVLWVVPVFSVTGRPGSMAEAVQRDRLEAPTVPRETGSRFRVSEPLAFGDAQSGDDRDEAGAAIRPAPLRVLRGEVAGRSHPAPGPAMTDAEVWAHYEPSREELEYRARMIEGRAEKELQNLLRVVPLDEERQDRVFRALVQSSEWYHPALEAVSSSGNPVRWGSPGDKAGTAAIEAATAQAPSKATEAVLAELTPEEAGVYERYTSERTAFWAGVVEDVERQLQETP